LFYTRDGAARDEDGYIWIKGHVDGSSFHLMFLFYFIFRSDNGFSFSSRCYQCVWTSILYGEFKYDSNNETALNKELVLQVRKVIDPFAAPKKIYIIGDLPKTRTRSGKIMRRIMRKIVAGEVEKEISWEI
jgi:acetyl-CoA synthetase